MENGEGEPVLGINYPTTFSIPVNPSIENVKKLEDSWFRFWDFSGMIILQDSSAIALDID